MFGHSFSAINSFMDSTMCRKAEAFLYYYSNYTERTILDVVFSVTKTVEVPLSESPTGTLYSFGVENKTYEYGKYYGQCFQGNSYFKIDAAINTYSGMYASFTNKEIVNDKIEKKEKLKRPKIEYYIHEYMNPKPEQKTEKFDIPEDIMNGIEKHFEEIKKEERESCGEYITNLRDGCLCGVRPRALRHSFCAFFCQKGENKIDGNYRCDFDKTLIDTRPSIIIPPNKIDACTYLWGTYRFEMTGPFDISAQSRFGIPNWGYTKVGTAPPYYVFPPDEIIPLQ